MKFEKTEVWGFEHSIRGLRNPLESWGKSDSGYGCYDGAFVFCEGCNSKENKTCNCKEFVIGKNDLELMQKLIKAGSEHRKFMRQIFIQTEIEANVYEWLKMENKFIDKSVLPDNFENMQEIKRTISMNYEVAYSTKYKYGKDYDNWLKTLPYSNELIFIGEQNDK